MWTSGARRDGDRREERKRHLEPRAHAGGDEGRLDVCRLLVEDVRVDVNQPVTDDEGNTAVFISAMLGTAATTRYLLDCGADPTVAGSMGSALHGAVMNGQYETIELLLSRGIDVDLFDSVHGTALHVAASKGEAGMVKLLLEHHAVDYGKACKAFEDGLKLDRTNVDIKNALREAQEALKSADCAENNELFGVN
ncbi:hypothetical protein ACQ4PT_038077 [Festuca glaucescens]